MGSVLLNVLWVIAVFEIATANLNISYRFEVYPVCNCPMNKAEFEAAAKRRNCSKNKRYLCAPNRDLSSLIEFCTDAPKRFFGPDNCVKLEGTGDLDHYNCKERFNSSCPKTSYYDEDIYKSPACLTINVDKRCFVAEKDCPERKEVCGNQPTEDSNATADIIIYIVAVVIVFFLAVMMTIYLKKVFKNREKRGGNCLF